MFTDPDHCYQALASHDARFDGRFFVGVRTTGIYCRPVCRVRLPKRENCSFYPSAAAAETAGFRPCLRCRPELAPGWSSTDIEARLAQAGGRLIEAGTVRIADVAQRLGVSERHFRRIFHKAYGVSPGTWRQTQRLLLAKQLLSDTTMPVLDVALAAGFGSARRLNATLQARYALTPSDLRRRQPARESSASHAPVQIALRLGVHAPHATAALFAELARTAIPGLSHGNADEYARVLSLHSEGKRCTGTLHARAGKGGTHIMLSLSASLLPVVSDVLAIARDLFDANADPAALEVALGPLADGNPGLRVPGVADGFEAVVCLLVEAALPAGQAIDALAALVRRAGEPLKPERAGQVGTSQVSVLSAACPTSKVAELRFRFPEAAEINELDASNLLACGLPDSLIASLRSFIELYMKMSVDLSSSACVDTTLAQLASIPGMQQALLDRIAMQVLRWPDAFPGSDPDVQRQLGVHSRKQALAIAAQWRPWRAYAAMHLLHDTNSES